MASISWEKLSGKEYVGLFPWAWIELESSNPLGPFPFLGGVDPKVVSCLDEVHRHLGGAIDIVISDLFAGRAPLKDPELPKRLENAYMEVVHSRPHLRKVIRCGRKSDGSFEWDYPLDENKSSPLSYSRMQILNSHRRQSVPFELEPSLAPVAGRFIGCLNGTLTVAEVRNEINKLGEEFGEGATTYLMELLEILLNGNCLALSEK